MCAPGDLFALPAPYDGIACGSVSTNFSVHVHSYHRILFLTLVGVALYELVV